MVSIRLSKNIQLIINETYTTDTDYINSVVLQYYVISTRYNNLETLAHIQKNCGFTVYLRL